MEPKPKPQSAGATSDFVGRYFVYKKIAAGGMATVHLGRLTGVGGFSRTVAIKRLLPQLATNETFVSMFLEEAKLASRIVHPNVLTAIDVVTQDDQLLLVMDYVHGESLARLMSGGRLGPGIVSAIIVQVLNGLHSIHEATGNLGQPLGIVHRDVSPQNVLVGADGIARVVDLGIAKATSGSHDAQHTQAGQVKGKLAYMSPEQVQGQSVDRRSDIFAVGVLLWESLTGRRLFGSPKGASQGEVVAKLLLWDANKEALAGVPSVFRPILRRALAQDPGGRYSTAQDMATALTKAVRPADTRSVSEVVRERAHRALRTRAALLEELAALPNGIPKPSQRAGPPSLPVWGNSDEATVAEWSPQSEKSRPGTTDDSLTGAEEGRSGVTSLTASRALDRVLSVPSRRRQWPVRAIASVLAIIVVLLLIRFELTNGVAEAPSAERTDRSAKAVASRSVPASPTGQAVDVTSVRGNGAAAEKAAAEKAAAERAAAERAAAERAAAERAAAEKAAAERAAAEKAAAEKAAAEKAAAEKAAAKAAQRARAAQRAPAPTPGRSTNTPADSCAIPYVVLEGNIKRYKPECFGPTK